MAAKLAELSFKPAMDVKIIVGSSDAADKIRRLAEAGFNQKVFLNGHAEDGAIATLESVELAAGVDLNAQESPRHYDGHTNSFVLEPVPVSAGTDPVRQALAKKRLRLETISVVVLSMPVPSQRPVVLVVEDESLVRSTATNMVEEAGFEAIAASDADEAIRILESRNDIRPD